MPRNITANQARAHFTRHPLTPSSWNGVRDDIDPWFRRGHGLAPVIANRDIAESVEWMHARRGRQWGPDDAELIAELDRRAWGWGEVQRQRFWSLPSWVTPELVPNRRMGGYTRFLGVLIQAFRRGSLGALLSYEECMALCGVGSRSTWRDWTAEMEARGLIRIVQTWVQDKDHASRPRRHGRLYYRIGPALESAAGYGIIEGAAPDEKRERWAARAAMGARARAREARNEVKGELWSTHTGDDGADAQSSAAPAPTTPEATPVAEPPAPAVVPAMPEDQASEAPEPAPAAPVEDPANDSEHRQSVPQPVAQLRARRENTETREMRPAPKSGTETRLAPIQAVQLTDHTPPAYGSEAPAPEGPGSSSLRSRQRRPSQASPPGRGPATAPELDPRRRPDPGGGGAQTGVTAKGGARKHPPGSLDRLWSRLMDSPHTDPALRASLLRLKRGPRDG